MRVIRVAVADDDPAFRGALVDVLEADSRFAVVAVLERADDVAAAVTESRADVVILDVRMPGGGPEAARAIREGSSSRPPVVVAISAQSSAHTVAAMLREGAVGYLVKGRIGSDLPDLLGRCAAGEVVLAVPNGASALRELTRSAPLETPAT